jgi:hypothetical protein
METIRLRSRSGEDGILHLDLPMTMKEVEWDVTVTIQPVAPPSQGKGYPAGFFEIVDSKAHRWAASSPCQRRP